MNFASIEACLDSFRSPGKFFGDFDIKMAFDLEILKNDINKKSVPFDRNDDTNREIWNFPPQKSKILPQNHRKKFENWKLKIHVKFYGVLDFE